MKTYSEFDTFYKTTLLPSLKASNRRRQKTRLKNLFVTIGYIFLMAAIFSVAAVVNRIIYGVWFDEHKANIPFVVALITAIILFIYYIRKLRANRGDYVQQYKNSVISEIVRFVDESLQYQSGNWVALRDFNASKLFYPTPDKYFGDDFVGGKIGKTEIAFSEVHAKYKTVYEDSENGTSEKWTKIFDGLFFKADFNKDFNGEYFLFSEKRDKTIRRIKKSAQPIHLEDREFAKQFVVYGSDQVEARYILSTSLMKRLLDFKQQTGKKIKIAFAKSSIYIAIPYKKPLFEPKYYRSVVSKKDTMEYFFDLKTAVNIVEELDLNTRIWSKQ